jgi:hypothetical protein
MPQWEEWHTYENGLCFYRFDNGRLCNRRAVQELRDVEGNGHGIYCERHLPRSLEEWRSIIECEIYGRPFQKENK